MKVTWKRGLGIGLALVLVIAAGVYSSDHFLKATDGDENIVEPTEAGEEAAPVEEVFEEQDEDSVVAIVQGVFESDLLEEQEPGESVTQDDTEVLPEETADETAAEPDGETADEETETAVETVDAVDEETAVENADAAAETEELSAQETVSAGDELTTEEEAVEEETTEEESTEEEVTEEATEEESTEEQEVLIAYEVVGGKYTGAGSKIKLYAVVTGYKDPSYQWQYDDGSGWKDIKGATNSVYTLEVTEKNISYTWRVDVE
jgi:hypothetical protein